ncbi:radical SAM family heme chaperone HemW [Nitrospirales bacterium NOB]|nr:radical SAM family heme chaperone HemW [Nitrospira sp. NTP2]MDL1890222.1 radical SAM family heme chaperone HemW [Nitrospirales bacterium NOB]
MRVSPMDDRASRGLYLHIPFCQQRCHFCAFYLEIHQPEAAEAFVESLLAELQLYGAQDPFDGAPLDSIYFGGGTPTTLTPQHLSKLLSTARRTFGLAQDAEITVEAHPASVSREGLSRLRQAGFTRLSFGAESMDQQELTLVGRPGSPTDTATMVAAARDAGFVALNLDLMYGLPGQTLASWARSLREVLELDPTHISCYALTVEAGTRLQGAVQRGLVPAPDEGLQNEMEDMAEGLLREAGYNRYEISNYCRPGFASRHNRLYWTGGQYLGLGPSAQSYVNGRRFGNVADLALYNRMLRRGECPIEESQQLPTAVAIGERVVFGLRLTEGVSLQHVGVAAIPSLARRIDDLVEVALLERAGNSIRLTTQGRRYADHVALSLWSSVEAPPSSAAPIDFRHRQRRD